MLTTTSTACRVVSFQFSSFFSWLGLHLARLEMKRVRSKFSLPILQYARVFFFTRVCLSNSSKTNNSMRCNDIILLDSEHSDSRSLLIHTERTRRRQINKFKTSIASNYGRLMSEVVLRSGSGSRQEWIIFSRRDDNDKYGMCELN